MTEYTQHIIRPLKVMGMFSLIAVLTACGGGGGSGNSFTQPVTESKTQSSGDDSLSSSAQTKSLDSIKLSSSSSVSSKSSSKSNAASSKAAQTIDTIPPVLAEDITVLSALNDRIAMEWTPATDNVGVVSYKIYRNQVQIGTLPGTQDDYVDFNVSPNKSYSYSITAGDAAGNWSTVKTIKVQTPAVVVQSSLSSVARSSVSSSSIVTSSSIRSGVSSSSRSGTSNSSISSSASSRSSLVSSTQSSSISSLPANSVSGNVTLKWTAPVSREDGNRLYATEIGGYEIRYISSSDDSYTYIVIDDGAATSYTLHDLAGNYTFEISAFDTDNLYSNFSPISPR